QFARVLAIARKYASVPDVPTPDFEHVEAPEPSKSRHPTGLRTARLTEDHSDQTNPIEPTENVRKSSGMFNNVLECSAPARSADYETNPKPAQLTPRQIAAARLLALGRSGRAVARELCLEEHTITRWWRLSAFVVELDHQQNLAMMYRLHNSPAPSSNKSQPEQRHV